ncbi:MAG: hypothetical protein LBV12_10750 [Puniceicoccales bacterium]|jgi:phosphate-selective porin OprO/OprP|nr:hypothetical protein [Puniceicoccales bacterium]
MTSVTGKHTLVLFLASASTFSSLGAQDAVENESTVALREQIQQLDQKLRILERKQELREEASENKTAPSLPSVSLDDKGLNISSADKAYSVKIWALVQADARFFLDDGAANRDSFLLRRVRTPLTGTVASIFDFNVTPEFSTGTNTSTSAGLVDAFLAARITPWIGIKGGKFISPVVLNPGQDRYFLESAYPNTLAPNRDLGFEFFGAFGGGIINYRLGIYNGAPNNTQNFGGQSPGLSDGDFTGGGRLTLTPFKNTEGFFSDLSLGIGGSIGNERGDASTRGLTNIVSNGQQTLLNWSSGNGLYADGQHIRLSPAIEWYTDSPLSFVTEFIWERQDLANDAGFSRTVDNFGWRVNLGYVLTGETATRNGVNPDSPFDLGKGTWGAFEVVGRLSGLYLDNDIFDDPAGLNGTTNAKGAFAYGLGLNWYLNRNIRVLFNVEKTDYRGGGAPTGQTGVRDDELYVFSRFQIVF